MRSTDILRWGVVTLAKNVWYSGERNGLKRDVAIHVISVTCKRGRQYNCQFTIKLEIPIKTTIRSLSIFSIFVFWMQVDWYWDDMTNRFQWIRPVHTKPILLHFEIFPRAFWKVCVFIVFVWTEYENATKCLRFQMETHSCGRGLIWEHGRMAQMSALFHIFTCTFCLV